mmetsp:Transcript_62558/g.116320  ORF Transcript_62558/g.116320 Transcript_62558/m.116320 type:complete len:453 (+) Transcript_62558:107-1465(+)
MLSTARVVILIAVQLGLQPYVLGTAVAAKRRQGNSLTFLKRGRDVSDDDSALPPCSCNCCNVAPRRPDEVSAGVLVKCSANSVSDHSSDVCQSQCMASNNDHILSFSSGQVLDHQRFCFFECKPAEGKHSPVHTQCIDLEEEEAKQAVDKNGDALDPAFLYEHAAAPKRAALLGKAPAPAAAMTPAEASKLISDSAKQATDSGKAALATAGEVRDKEAVYAGKLNARLLSGKDPAAPRAFNAYGSVLDVHESAETAEAAAESAARAAKDAEEALEQARGAAWLRAHRAADEEVDRVRKEASEKREAMLNPPKTLRERAQEAATDASMPYLKQASIMVSVVHQYNETAMQLSEQGVHEVQQATALRIEAQELREKFNITENNVNPHDWDKLIASRKADLLLAEAKAHLMQAKFTSEQQTKVLGRMNYLHRAIPLYQQYAKAAAVSAARSVETR